MFELKEIQIQPPIKQPGTWTLSAVMYDGARRKIVTVKTDDPLKFWADAEAHIKQTPEAQVEDYFALVSAVQAEMGD